MQDTNKKTFLPEGYKQPQANNNYMKLQDGENKMRILSHPIIGWEEWIENKPCRYNMADKPNKPFDANRPLRHFWAMIVWNYNEEKIQIYQASQSTILKGLNELVADSDWGDPFFYDIKIKKDGEGKDTKYWVSPIPHKDLKKGIQQAYKDKPCYLDALFSAEDPFMEWDTYTEGVFSKKECLIEKAVKTFTDEDVQLFKDKWEHQYSQSELSFYLKERADTYGHSVAETVTELAQDAKVFVSSIDVWMNNNGLSDPK